MSPGRLGRLTYASACFNNRGRAGGPLGGTLRIKIIEGRWKGQEGEFVRNEGEFTVALMPGSRLVEFLSAHVEPVKDEPAKSPKAE